MAVQIFQHVVETPEQAASALRVHQHALEVAIKAPTATIEFNQSILELAEKAPTATVAFNQHIIELPFKLAPPGPPIPEVLPYLFIPPGQGQRINELEGHSSIPTLNFETIDVRGELKRLAAETDIVGKLGRFRLGFPGMAMTDFVTLHTTQLTDVGRIGEGRMSFDSVELLNFVRGEVFKQGGPHSEPGIDDPPAPPLYPAFAANAYPIGDKNPRYLQGHPIDILLVVYQNELGIGQATADPAGWQIYTPGNDATLINPNRYLDVPGLLALRGGMFGGTRFEFKLTRPVDGKRWVDDQILKILGLYTIIRPDGSLAFKSMKSPANPSPVAMTRDGIIGIPEVAREPIINVVTVRFAVEDTERETAARDYRLEYSFQAAIGPDGKVIPVPLSNPAGYETSAQRYRQQYKQAVEADGLRIHWGGYRLAFLLSDRIFRRHAFATPKYSIEAHLQHVDLELGDFILLTHSLVLDYTTGKLGLSNVLCEIVDKQPVYDRGRVRFEALDTRFMAVTTPYYIADALDLIPDWTLASAEQKAYYMFISFAPNGTYSDDAPGNTIF